MINQYFLQTISEADAWKCINCGNIISRKEKTLESDTFSLFYHQEKIKKKKH